MTKKFEQLLDILRYTVLGKQTKYVIDDGYEEVYKLAIEQGVFTLVYPVISKQDTSSSQDKWKNIFLSSIIKNERKKYFLKTIICEFDNRKIDYCLLKGVAVANAYFLSECRISGDIDILISPHNEEAAMSLMEQLGMRVIPRSREEHHFKAYHKEGGLIEVHTSLYNKKFNDIVLKNKFALTEPYSKIAIDNDYTVNSLGVKDGLNFLTGHLIKHFVKEGCGIRQVTDLLAYITFYKEEIDFDEYIASLKELNFDSFIKNVLGIGVEYFDLDFGIYETEYIERILNDIEKGGNFGFSDDERRGVYENFLKHKSDMTGLEFESKMTRDRKGNIIKNILLPNRRFLISKGYRYLKNSVLLYPIAYVHRGVDVIKLLISKKRHLSDMNFTLSNNTTIEDRIDLMKELNII